MENNIFDYKAIGFAEGKVKENNVIAFLHNHARLFPDKIALQWVKPDVIRNWDGKSDLYHERINYRELIEKIAVISAGLKSTGINKGDRVIIFVPLSLELYLTMFAVQRLGAIAVFLDSWARKDHLGITADIVAPKGMISFEQAFDLCQTVPQLASIPIKIVVGPHRKDYIATLEDLLRTKEECEIELVSREDTALITFTTGSSGAPKGADRTHRFLAAQHKALETVLPYTDKDRDLPVFPIFSLNNLAGGVTTVLPAIDLGAPSTRDGAIIVQQIFSANVTSCTISPSIFVNIAEYCKSSNISLFSLRRVVTGGAPVSRDNVIKFKEIAPKAEILILYGSTEVEPIAHIEAGEMLADTSQLQGVNVGRICNDLGYKFIRIWPKNIELGDKGWAEWEMEPGKAGELVVSGDHVCEKYYNNPEAFKATKIKDTDGRIWHRTGDVGMLDNDNNLWLVGRVHNTIIRGNEYLFPVHAEILLKKLEFVRQAAFLGLEDKALGQKACAVFTLQEGFTADKENEYRRKIEEILSKNMIPVDEIRLVNSIPLDPRHHSKVEYSKLKEMLAAHG